MSSFASLVSNASSAASSAGANVHCTCCHVCHVSMKQRPRQLLACSSCNTIICRTCLETRWRTDQWEAGAQEGSSWVCHKCRGDCPCKSCRGRATRPLSSSSSSTRRPLDDSSSDLWSPNDDEASFAAPVKRAATVSNNVPTLAFAPGFQLINNNNNNNNNNNLQQQQQQQQQVPQQPVLSHDRIGLGVVLDGSLPVHRKVVELSRQRDRCDATIANMRGLLTMLEHERSVLDGALNDLIKQTTGAVGGSLSRSNSHANFDDAVSPSKPTAAVAAMKRSNSQCNLEEFSLQQNVFSPSNTEGMGF